MCPAKLHYLLPMYNSTFQLRRWAAGLTVAALPLIGIALAPSSFADPGYSDDPGSSDTGPCAWDVASVACMEWEQGGAASVCGFSPDSMGCLEAGSAAN